MVNLNLIPAPPVLDLVGNTLPATRTVLRELGPTDKRERETFEPEVSLDEGTVVFQRTSGANIGLIAAASASVIGTAMVAGVLLRPAKPGKAVGVLQRGKLAGFDLSAVPVGTPLYLSNTDGKIGTTPGTIRVCIGVVRQLNDIEKTKYVVIDIPQNQDPRAS